MLIPIHFQSMFFLFHSFNAYSSLHSSALYRSNRTHRRKYYRRGRESSEEELRSKSYVEILKEVAFMNRNILIHDLSKNEEFHVERKSCAKLHPRFVLRALTTKNSIQCQHGLGLNLNIVANWYLGPSYYLPRLTNRMPIVPQFGNTLKAESQLRVVYKIFIWLKSSGYDNRNDSHDSWHSCRKTRL